jgi:hypothetical protein
MWESTVEMMKLWSGAFWKNDIHEYENIIFLNRRTDDPAIHFFGEFFLKTSNALPYAINKIQYTPKIAQTILQSKPSLTKQKRLCKQIRNSTSKNSLFKNKVLRILDFH